MQTRELILAARWHAKMLNDRMWMHATAELINDLCDRILEITNVSSVNKPMKNTTRRKNGRKDRSCKKRTRI